MKLSKNLFLITLFFIVVVLPAYGQQPRPRGGAPAAGRNEAARRAITEQQRELRTIEMLANNPHEDVDPIKVRQMQIKKDLTELNEVTLTFLRMLKEEYQTMPDRGEVKEVAKMADKIAKSSKKLREDLELNDFEVKVNPMELPITETRTQHLTKLAQSMDELIEQINISQASRNASEVKLKILARHLTALETHATSAKEVAKDKH